MSKITLTNVADLTQSVTAATTINTNSATVQIAFDNTLSRDGTSPNQMLNTLDMNSNQILNLPQPATAGSPVRLQDVQAGATVTNIPPGGLTGQVLGKTSNTSYQVGWQDQSTDLVAGNNIVLTGTTPTTIATTNQPTFSVGTITPQIFGGVGTGSSLSVASTTNVAPSGDALNLYGSTVNLSSTVSTAKTVNIGGSGGGVTVNIASAGDGLNSLNVYNGAGSKQTWIPGGGATTVTFPTATDQLVARNTSDTLTNKTITSASNTITLGSNTVSTSTGTGNLVYSNTPGLINPVLAFTAPTGNGNLGFNNGTALNWGDGTVNHTAVSLDQTQTLTNKTLTTPTIGTSLSFSPTTGGVVGTTAGDNAAAGIVGEALQSQIASGSALTLTSGTPLNVTSITLTAGDWEVSGVVQFTTAASTSVTNVVGSISSTSATLDVTRLTGGQVAAVIPGANTGAFNHPLNPTRFNVTTSTTVFLVAQATFTVAALTTFGTIRARRVR